MYHTPADPRALTIEDRQIMAELAAKRRKIILGASAEESEAKHRAACKANLAPLYADAGATEGEKAAASARRKLYREGRLNQKELARIAQRKTREDVRIADALELPEPEAAPSEKGGK